MSENFKQIVEKKARLEAFGIFKSGIGDLADDDDDVVIKEKVPPFVKIDYDYKVTAESSDVLAPEGRHKLYVGFNSTKEFLTGTFKTCDVEKAVIAPSEMVEKLVYVVFFSGQQARTKILEICEPFGANCYPVPEDTTEQRQLTREVLSRLSDLEATLDAGTRPWHNALNSVGYSLTNWMTTVKRCGEMSRKLRFFKDQFDKTGLRCSPHHELEADIELDLELPLWQRKLADDHEHEVLEMNSNSEKLRQTYNTLLEFKIVLPKASGFHVSSNAHALGEETELHESTYSSNGFIETASLLEQEMNPGPSNHSGLRFIGGIINKDNLLRFERMLFRATRGNMLFNQTTSDKEIMDPSTSEMVEKVVFFSGEQARTKILKICEAFGANCYPVPEDTTKQRQLTREVLSRLSDLEATLDAGSRPWHNTLNSVGYSLTNWMTMSHNPQRIMRVPVFTVGCEPGSEYGKLEVGSSSDQHATDEESSILSDGVAVVGVRVFRVGTMAPLRIKLNKLLSEYQKAEWSLVVPAGRYISVDPGQWLVITGISFTEEQPLCPNPTECEIYLGINSTKAEFLIGRLDTATRRQLPIEVFLHKRFTLGHSGFSSVRFRGYCLEDNMAHPSEVEEQPANQVSWPLNLDLTAQVLSCLSSAEVANAECVCKFFRAAGGRYLSYRDVDLCDKLYGEDLTALVCMRRARGHVRSVSVGYTYKLGQVDYNVLYTRRFLEPLQYFGTTMTKLKLVGLELITAEDLTPVFAGCPRLTDVVMQRLWLVPVEYVLQMVAAHCKSLTCLDYTCANSQNAVLTEAAEAILHAFVGSCTEVTSLVLCGVNLSDFKIQIILEGFKKLQSLDLSHSRGFTGTCFVDVEKDELILEVLRLHRCEDILEVHLRTFFLQLHGIALFCKLKKLTVTGVEGCEGRIGLQGLVEARPAMEIEISLQMMVVEANLDLDDFHQFLLDNPDPTNGQQFDEEDDEDVINYDGEEDDEVDEEDYDITLVGREDRTRSGLILWG